MRRRAPSWRTSTRLGQVASPLSIQVHVARGRVAPSSAVCARYSARFYAAQLSGLQYTVTLKPFRAALVCAGFSSWPTLRSYKVSSSHNPSLKRSANVQK
ncbi:MAG: hypothetical protein HGB19_00780 [Chlorobiales bacterium]|nr:hypothetical protein [Chlorobiales bacterium]